VYCTIRKNTKINNIVAASVADPDDFLSDLDPTLERPDPVPDLNKILDKLRLEIFLIKICSKSIVTNPKVKQQRFLKFLWLLHTSKKFI
jgi:hypothetical protein